MTSIISSSGSTAAGRISISSLDTDGDGIISAEELEAAKSSRTQDPTVTTESAATGAQSQLQSSMMSMLLQSSSAQTEGEQSRDSSDLFSAIDADGDGKITQEEFVAARPEDVSEEDAAARFAELDTEDSGFLTEDTFAAGMPQPPSGPSDMFSAIDADGDGKITQEEFVAARPEDISEDDAAAMFAELDTEDAGFLTEDTFAAGMSQPPQPISGDTEATTDDGTVSIMDILAEMERVIDAYRENGTEQVEA